MTCVIHGGNIWEHHRKVLDFSASLNPLGMPECVKRAAMEGIEVSVHYPDPDCRELRRAIAETQSVKESWCICGNGAADLLDRLMLAMAPKRCMLCPPTFGEYERAARNHRCKPLFHYLKEDQGFTLSQRILRTLRPGLDLLILCNPNNPTGEAASPRLLEEILKLCQKNGTFLLVDESFLDLTEAEYACPMTKYLEDYDNLLLLRSLTKSYAMPGLRLGYLLTSNTALLERMKDCGQPWSVSVPAQYAGVAALREAGDWPQKGRVLVEAEKKRLLSFFREHSIQTFDSRANYILFRVPGVTDLRERLLEHDILIRSCASFRGLEKDYYRIAVRTKKENTILMNTLEQLLQEKEERTWQDPTWFRGPPQTQERASSVRLCAVSSARTDSVWPLSKARIWPLIPSSRRRGWKWDGRRSCRRRRRASLPAFG